MKSIIQNEKCCFKCGTTRNLEDHHVFFGTSDRKISEKNGLKVWLCADHHRGNYSPHMDRDFDLELKQEAQRIYELNHSRNEFMGLFFRNYLED